MGKRVTPFPKISGWIVIYKCVKCVEKRVKVIPPPITKHLSAFISSSIVLGLSFLLTTISFRPFRSNANVFFVFDPIITGYPIVCSLNKCKSKDQSTVSLLCLAI
ncbi:uncharacterized protein METZ01_LOCUS184703 [marine metagenome]|uniref:Uncharacterized protein n=1 Tax=marine metagenome TaxID=408172 RepID=A0A382D176_9ZZZZ